MERTHYEGLRQGRPGQGAGLDETSGIRGDYDHGFEGLSDGRDLMLPAELLDDPGVK